MPESISLITYNTWHCKGDYLSRIELMHEEMLRLRPDVLLMQEAYVERDSGLSTPAILADALDLRYCYVPTTPVRRKHGWSSSRGWSGMAVASRLPIVAATALPLASPLLDSRRVAQLVTLQHGEGRLLVINAHLTYLRVAEGARIRQLASILSHPWLQQEHAAVLLAGDLNSPPASRAMRWLRNHPRWHVTDCFSASAPDALRGSTLGKEWTRDGVGPNVDYVLLLERASAPGSLLKPVAADYVLNRPATAAGIYPSDHLGVRVRFGKSGAENSCR